MMRSLLAPLAQMSVSFAAFSVVASCGGTTSAPASPTSATPSCTLDRVLGELPTGARICNEDVGGVCGAECQRRLEACYREATAAKQPFVLRWTNNMIDGHGTQEAFVGRLEGDTLAIRGYELVAVSGYDPHSDTMGQASFTITEQTCAALAPTPDPHIARDIQLRCATDAPKTTVCTE